MGVSRIKIRGSNDKTGKSTLDYLTGGFHSGAITGLSCAVRKPLVATSSNDRTVRVWNYSTNTIEFWKDFSEEVYTVSIHPAGHQLLAGFSDKLRLLNILIDDFRVVREFPIRGCREVSFSNGGHLFAAVHGNIIQTFSTITFEPLRQGFKLMLAQWRCQSIKMALESKPSI